ncbi:MAG: twin-arginine translocase TatA/TatE family subunit [Phototrophicales bacterium]|nr:MAG: twin-arginine translocase TatA/TatE family subunit [Phototrophicales bacterium]RMG70237.1 MAG: twin-arginine translocase TatA/TatE family subunit [Chloroflexota bacterium]
MPGIPELLIILVIVLVLFGGAGRISRLGGELGAGIANFRRGLKEGDNEENKPKLNDEN